MYYTNYYHETAKILLRPSQIQQKSVQKNSSDEERLVETDDIEKENGIKKIQCEMDNNMDYSSYKEVNYKHNTEMIMNTTVYCKT